MWWGSTILFSLASLWTVLCFLFYTDRETALHGSLPVWILSGLAWVALYYPVSTWRLAREEGAHRSRRPGRNPRRQRKRRGWSLSLGGILLGALALAAILLAAWFRTGAP